MFKQKRKPSLPLPPRKIKKNSRMSSDATQSERQRRSNNNKEIWCRFQL